MIEAIASVGAVSGVGAVNEPANLPSLQPAFQPSIQPGGPLADSQSVGDGGKFDNWFTNQLNNVNGQLQTVDREMQTVALDGTQSLHQFMIHMEEAKLSFQLVMQVRNRLLEAYQEVMRTQV